MAATATAAPIDTSTPEGKVAAMQERFPEVDPRMLGAYLKYKKENLDEAIALYEEFKTWRAELGTVDITSIEANLRAGGGHGPFMMTLEYQGDAVGKHTPIILLQGMIKGTRDEMIKQVVYAAERAGDLMPEEGPARCKFIVNTRGGAFRPPDSDYRAAVFDVMQKYYPWLANCQVIFLDPLYVVKVALWGLGKFLPNWKETFRAASSKDWPEGVDEDVGVYVSVTPEEKALKWGADGGVVFDMEAYIADRKAAEGLGRENPDASASSSAVVQATVAEAAASAAAGVEGMAAQMESTMTMGMTSGM